MKCHFVCYFNILVLFYQNEISYLGCFLVTTDIYVRVLKLKGQNINKWQKTIYYIFQLKNQSKLLDGA